MDMIENQIISRGISDQNVIDAMRKVKRDLFVEDYLKKRAYQDNPLPIGYGQTISQPYIVAYMTEVLCLKREDKVLEIGTGSGYQTAILAAIVNKVYSIEKINELSTFAKNNLEKAGFNNFEIKNSDGYMGWKEKSPFDAIIVTAAASKVPEPLLKQLSKKNGRMIIPLGEEYGYQELVLLKKNGRDLTIKRLLPVRFVPFVSNYLI